MENSHSGQFAVVTGASSGIGLELAKVFAEHGFDVLMAAEDAGLEDAAERVRALGTSAITVRVDLATPEGVERLYERIQSSGRAVDAIAINAGVGVGGPFLETDLDAELNLIRLNVVSTVHLAKLVLPDMARRGAGRVLFTSSIAADMPAPFEAVYGASKAFVQSFAEAVRNELKGTNVTVTSLQPGATDTNFFHRADMEDTKVGAGKKDDPEDVARQGFEALMAGKDHVVAGSMKNKVQDAMAKFGKETMSAQLHRKQSEPGSARE
jgi:short-subunit dehydrogenase